MVVIKMTIITFNFENSELQSILIVEASVFIYLVHFCTTIENLNYGQTAKKKGKNQYILFGIEKCTGRILSQKKLNVLAVKTGDH